jgi:predicted RNase H-like nuclease (RuvC/YqgF family)
VSYGFGLMIEGLVAILLLVTIGYCMVLNNRLKRLKADEQALKATIAELVTAIEIAERAVAGLKTTARECESTLGERLGIAERCCAELSRQVSAGDMVIERLARVVVASRKLDEVPPAAAIAPLAQAAAASKAPAASKVAAAAPDPKAVAAAARSLADRLRERMGALAA